jgi:hypothetical protein
MSSKTLRLVVEMKSADSPGILSGYHIVEIRPVEKDKEGRLVILRPGLYILRATDGFFSTEARLIVWEDGTWTAVGTCDKFRITSKPE